MKNIRRIYFYIVAFVSLEVIVWSVISLMRSVMDVNSYSSGNDQLAIALAFILVGLPIFLIHWRVVQRDASVDPIERFSGMRAIFLYGTWLALLLPVTQNVLAVVERTLALLLNVDIYRVSVGGYQAWSDNLIGIIVNGILAGYFYTVIKANWEGTPQGNSIFITRRIWRYFWMLYGFGLAFAGVQQLLSYLFFELEGDVGFGSGVGLVDGIAFTLIGIPIWVFTWRLIRSSLSDLKEKDSKLRQGILYSVTFLAVIITLISGGSILNLILRSVLGDESAARNIVYEIGRSLSMGLPSLVTWLYFGRELKQDMGDQTEIPRRASMNRLYVYVLSLLGLGATFVGMLLLITSLLDMIVNQAMISESYLQASLANALTNLLIGLPLWLWAWRPMISEASQEDESGDHARRSVIRKGYLYLVLFVGVMGIMGSTGTLLYNFILVVLGEQIPDFLYLFLSIVSTLLLFIVLANYHWRALQSDNKLAVKSLSVLHTEFSVGVFDSGDGKFSEQILSALKVLCPDIPAAVHTVGEKIDDSLKDARAVILPSYLATNPPEAVRLWVEEFSGVRVVVPTPTEGWAWVGIDDDSPEDLVKEAAEIICRLAEGQEISQLRSRSPLTVLGYIFGVLVGISILCMLISFVAEMV